MMRAGLIAIAALWLGFAGPVAIAGGIEDATGRHVELPDRIERVLPAGPPASVLLFTLAPDKMLGWAHRPGAAAAPFLGSAAELPETGPIASHGEPDLDRIRALKPDLILDVGTVSPRYADMAKRVQEATGIPYILLDGSLEATAATYRTLGAALGVAGRGNALAAASEKILAMPHAGALRTAYLGRGADGLSSSISNSINADVLKALGFQNVVGDGPMKVTAEQLHAWDPQIILTGDPVGATSLRADPAFAGRVHSIAYPPFGWLDEPPSVNRLLGVIWGNHVLNGASGDLAGEMRDFYRLFYRAALTDAQLAEIVK
jgi:iron complex transport system substrate-binding protein